MRPRSEEATALLQTALRLSAAGRGVTLAELAAGACVGQQAARHTVSNLKRHGHLKIVGLRRVSYRNRPVAEYALAAADAEPMRAPLVWLWPAACQPGHGKPHHD